MTHLRQGKVARRAKKAKQKAVKQFRKFGKQDSSTELIREMTL